MKIKHLLIGLFAVAATVACTQEQPAETPKLEVDKEAVSLAATAAESSFNVTSNQAWAATADADWVTLDPASGEAATEAVAVKVTAEDNTAKEARTAKVTVKAGELTKTVTVTQAAGEEEDPGKEPEPEDPNEWSMMGCFVDNLWQTDVPMTKEGEWIVAKDAQFTELTFKIRANASWDDATNIGVAPGSERGVVNGKITVVTAEYSKANLGDDAKDIKLNGEAGTYDVYFSFENLEVYVMEQGFKPGEKEPQTPEPVEITYTVAGTLKDLNWKNSAPEGLMVKEGDYYVGKNVPLVTAKTLYDGADQIEFKIVETGTWDGFAHAQKENENYINGEIPVQAGGENIIVKGAEGSYDVYFDKTNLKVWVMEAGAKPGEKEPLVPAPADYDIDGKQWLFTWELVYGASSVIDLGVTQPGVAIIAYDMGAIDPTLAGIIYPYIMSSYTITKTDGTSGVITLSAEGQSVEITYSKATDNTVHLACPTLLGEIDCTLATSPVQIYIEQPSASLPDGEYWIIADGKVATPLTSNYGYLEVVDAVNGKSTAANAFKFTQVEAGLYTIQDSNGKYYYQTGTYNNFSVADTDGMTDEYLWEVVEYTEGQYVIQNVKVAKAIQYDPNYNSYGSYEDLRGVLPNLVLAEDPIAEPEPEPEPEPESGVLAEWLFTKTAMADYADSFGGTAGVLDKTAGDGGKYVAANKAGTGKISYVQVDKTEVDADGKAKRIVGSSGHPYVYGIWSGDYWLFEATAATECPAGTKVNISYITRTSKTGHKYWRLEYLDGSEWKAAMDTEKKTVNEKEIEYNIAMNNDGETNVEVDATVTLSSATKDVKFRMLAVGDVVQSSNEALVTKPNGGTCRIAGAEGTSPVIKVVE